MDIRRKIGRALAPGANLSPSGDEDRFMPVDVLLALGSLKPAEILSYWGRVQNDESRAEVADIANLLIRIKWGRDESLRKKLESALVKYCRIYFEEHGWDVRARRIGAKQDILIEPGRTLIMFAAQCIEEFLGPRCPACHGTGFIFGKTTVTQCHDCNLTGIQRASSRARSEVMYMDRESFQKTWSTRMDEMLCELTDIEYAAIRRMNRLMKN